jgi:hypothetical protein
VVARTTGGELGSLRADQWIGVASTKILIYNRGSGQLAVILNGVGEIVYLLPIALPPRRPAEVYLHYAYGLRADMWGDSLEEVILLAVKGCYI